MKADLLNQIGLALGLISGLLLIPEIFNRIPIQRFEHFIEKSLKRITSWSKFPLQFHPPSWKRNLSLEQREAVEPITAFLGLIFSLVWISTLSIGIILPARSLILLSIMTVIAATLRHLRTFVAKGYRLTPWNFLPYFSFSLVVLIFLSPLGSFVRVIMIIIRSLTAKMGRFFAAHGGLREILTFLAILFFIVSNILQFIATFLE